MLDDGFQHLQIERDVDLLLLSEEDLSDRPLPGGRLREPLTAGGRRRCGAGVGRLSERRRSRGADGRDSNRVSGDPHARGAAHDCEAVRVCRRAVAVARVCGGRDCPARAFLFRCRGRGLGSRRLDGLSRPPSLHASRTSGASRRGAGGRGGHHADHREGCACAWKRAIWAGCRSPRFRSSSASSPRTGSATGSLVESGETPPRILAGQGAVRGRAPGAGRLARAAGTLLGRAVYTLDRTHRRIAHRNLASAFPTRPERERKAIARAAFAHFGRLLVELLKFSTLSEEAMLARVEFDGEDRARLAYAQGRGVLFFTGHFGFWELHALVHALRLEPFSVIARPLDNPFLHALLEQIRQRTGNPVIYRQGMIRRVMRTLQAGHGIAVLIDQHIQPRDAVYVDFFERPAATTSAIAALALRTGAPVVPCFALPLGAGRYRMVYEHPSSRRAPTGTTRSTSSRSDAPTCSRCTSAATPSCGCGCTGGGETMVNLRSEDLRRETRMLRCCGRQTRDEIQNGSVSDFGSGGS